MFFMRYTFADCQLNTETQTLMRSGTTVSVEPQVFDLLCLLAANAGKLVTKDQIVDEVWNGRIVSESAISARIAAARKAVGDDGKAQRVIQTVSRRGLRLVAEVDGAAGAGNSQNIARPRIRYATAPDGVRLAYAVSGAGPPVLRVSHGYTNIEREWDARSEAPIFRALSERFTLIRFDTRGSGLSRIPEPLHDAEVHARDMLAVANAVGVERFAIYSESGGALTAVTFSTLYPERVSRMVILGGYAEGPIRRGTTRSDAFKPLFEAGWNSPGSPFTAAWLSIYFPEGPHDLVAEMALEAHNTMSANTILAKRDYINNASILELLPRVEAPTLIVHGRNDSVHPLSEAKKLAAGIPDAELLVLDTANSMPLPGHPTWEPFLRDFLAYFQG